MAFRNKQTVEDKSEHRTSLYREIQEKKEIIPDFVFDGSIEIRNGELLFTPPRGLGRFPLIMAGENVEIYLNGNKIETPSFISDQDKVQIKTLDTGPSVNLEISLTEDNMKAFFFIQSTSIVNWPTFRSSSVICSSFSTRTCSASEGPFLNTSNARSKN